MRHYLTRFSDRPVRRAFVVADADFVRRLRATSQTPIPTRCCPRQPARRIPKDVVLQIGHPRWNPKTSTLTFSAVRIPHIEDNLPDTTVHIKPPLIADPRHFGRAGLFIDSAGQAVRSHLYWSSDIGGTIVEANLDGTNPMTIATGQSDPGGLAVDSSHLYWANGGTPTIAGTIIEGRGIGGDNPAPIATGQTGPLGVAVDSSHVYWANQSGLGTIIEANLDGTNPMTIATNQNGPTGVAVGP